MMLLVSGATRTSQPYCNHPRYGKLRTPRDRNRIDAIVASGVPWACDNDCFQRLDRAAYLRMLSQVAGKPRLLWVTAPDIVANARDTRARFDLWHPTLTYFGLPIAYVAQDGQETVPVPWEQIACLFIGGSTAWKLGACAAALIHEAHARSKWVHVGRVNTLKRMWWFSSLPVDSIDGSSFSTWPDVHIPWMIRHLDGVQHRMEGLLCEPTS